MAVSASAISHCNLQSFSDSFLFIGPAMVKIRDQPLQHMFALIHVMEDLAPAMVKIRDQSLQLIP